MISEHFHEKYVGTLFFLYIMVQTHIELILDDLGTFIASNPEAREFRKAIAVKMVYQDYPYRAIQELLGVSMGSISEWKNLYDQQGWTGFKSQHKGRRPYLTPEQRKEVFSWLQTKDAWDVQELEYHLAQTYDVIYESKQSYYDLFQAAGISWKKTTAVNPKADPAEVAAKRAEIKALLEHHRAEIEAGKIMVLFVDECHLLWGDVTGYVWGKTDQQIDVSVGNTKAHQTYYGGVNLVNGEVLLQPADRGNSDCTIAYLKYLIAQHPDVRFILIWDGATYHRSGAVREFLAEINQGETDPEQWRIHCVRFAPNCPQQNPIEDIWLQAKSWARKSFQSILSFAHLKWVFKWFITESRFNFEKLGMYGHFSEVK